MFISGSRKQVFMSLIDSLNEAVSQFPVINTHCHHKEEEFFKDMHLRRLLDSSYVSWAEPVPDPDTDAPLGEDWFASVRYNSYFVSLQKGMQALYGISEPLDTSSWEVYNTAIKKAHEDPEWHLKVLRENCGYEKIIQDSYWMPGDAPNDPMFTSTFRVNMFFYFHDTEVNDHNGNNVLRYFDIDTPFTRLPDYLAFVYDALKEWKDVGIALKCALAYDRDLAFSDESFSEARDCFEHLLLGLPRAGDLRRLQNYVFFRVCEMAGELDLPLQCHTGLGQLYRTNAMGLLPAIEANPKTKFVLFHGSYPYLQDMFSLCHNHKNVYTDICWLPIISPAAAARFVDEYIEVGAVNTMMWGCDTWTSEESVGALLTAREVLCKVVADKISAGYMNEVMGISFLRGVFSDNARILYKF